MGSTQKMRRTWFTDRPRNVSGLEYGLYTLQIMLVMTCLAGGAGMLLASRSGSTTRKVDEVAALPDMSVAGALAATSPAELVRVEGAIGATETVTLPDEPEVEVVLGSIRLVATERSGRKSREAVLFEWSHDPETLYLEAGDTRIPLEVDRDLLPRVEPRRAPQDPERLTDDAGPRLASTLGFRFLGKTYDLPGDWKGKASISTRVERSYLATGETFTVAARLETDGGAPRLTTPADRPVVILGGSLDQARARAKGTARVLSLAWLPTLIVGVLLALRVMRIRRNFVARSNQ